MCLGLKDAEKLICESACKRRASSLGTRSKLARHSGTAASTAKDGGNAENCLEQFRAR
jgi:hypothetical protein